MTYKHVGKMASIKHEKYGCTFNFEEPFRGGHSRGVDLMRPKGGKYPGISAEVDRSLREAAEALEEIEMDHSFQSFD